MKNNSEFVQSLHAALDTAFIDGTITSNLAYRPQFVYNDSTNGQKVLAALESELLNCEEFAISVAFITRGGVTPLLQTLSDLEKRGVHGRILTTDYLTFSDPAALDKLAGLKNIELRMFHTEDADMGFHTKGYIFKDQEIYRIIIGSSNMTQSALTKNMEWNTRIVSADQGEMSQAVLEEFENLWNSDYAISYETFIDVYREKYKQKKILNKIVAEQQKIAKNQTIPSMEVYKLKPNKMQVAFLSNLQKLCEDGAKRALLISATGTGKTYASAFALREENPKKALFLVHREQIAKQAIRSYKKVFGNTKTFGLLSGNSKELDADYLFSTMQMMTKAETMNRFKKDEFEVIVIDEVHRAGAESYARILNYFEPKFWLGMTASPDRTDGFDIYNLFDHNIVYEIRLQQALEENLLCPFHYFGITDLEINGEVFNDETGLKNFSHLVCDDRVDYVLDKAKYFGHSGERVKGLVFCSSKKEGRELSVKFNERGLRTVFLCGEDSQETREKCIEHLATNDIESGDYLDYIFTVDIFNEGVDIVEVNQIIMLRPTESSIIFIQQLGRGLRKADDKEYVVILDFIGNYTNNFLIPIALSGDRSYNKDTIRRFVREGSKVIPGSSSIHFDEISRKRIYASIDTARTNDLKLIKESYQQLKFKLGRIPSVADFKNYGSIDVMKIFDKCGSYYNYLVKYEKEYIIRLNPKEASVIEFLSKKVTAFKRVHELALLKHLLSQQNRIMAYFDKYMEKMYGITISSKVEESVYRNLTNEFGKEEEKKKYSACVFVDKRADGYHIASEFQEMLGNKYFSQMVMELIDFGIERYMEKFSHLYKDTNFSLYQKYTYEDVCRLLNWQRNMNAQNIGGYFYDADTKTLPVFINYDKAEDAIAYEDRFIAEDKLIALSKHPRKITSGDVTHIYKRSEADRDNRIFLFVRKNKDDNEAKEFYFLGEIYAQGEPHPIHMVKSNDDAFEIMYQLDVPVRNDIYDYIVR